MASRGLKPLVYPLYCPDKGINPSVRGLCNRSSVNTHHALGINTLSLVEFCVWKGQGCLGMLYTPRVQKIFEPDINAVISKTVSPVWICQSHVFRDSITVEIKIVHIPLHICRSITNSSELSVTRIFCNVGVIRVPCTVTIKPPCCFVILIAHLRWCRNSTATVNILFATSLCILSCSCENGQQFLVRHRPYRVPACASRVSIVLKATRATTNGTATNNRITTFTLVFILFSLL